MLELRIDFEFLHTVSNTGKQNIKNDIQWEKKEGRAWYSPNLVGHWKGFDERLRRQATACRVHQRIQHKNTRNIVSSIHGSFQFYADFKSMTSFRISRQI